MEYKLSMYRLRENRDMLPRTFASLVGTTLYEHRFGPFFVSPIVVGVQDSRAVLVTYDSIGNQTKSEKFAVGGTAGDNFYTLCESYYREGIKSEELEDILANVLVSGVDRDILSGYGGIVYVLTETGLEAKYLKMKQV